MLKRVKETNASGNTIFYAVDENGLKQGPFKIHDRHNLLESRGNYKDGKLNGIYESYYPSGHLKEKENYQNGELNGLCEYYSEFTHKVLQKRVYRHGTELLGDAGKEYLKELERMQEKAEKPEQYPFNFTLLTRKQVWGDFGDPDAKGKLDVLEQYGITSAPTDLTVLLGGNQEYDYRNIEGELACDAWTASIYTNAEINCIATFGGCRHSSMRNRITAVRPVLSPEETTFITPDVVKQGIKGINIAEHGVYPQTVADDKISEELENLYQSNTLPTTGKNYTFDSAPVNDYEAPFQPEKCPEYELKGEKYIRVIARSVREPGTLSTKKTMLPTEPYWVKVQPIEWLMDPSGTWVSKKCLLAGIQFDGKSHNHHPSFSECFVKQYLDLYFAKEVVPLETEAGREEKFTVKGLKEKLAEVSDLEKIKAAVKAARTPERTETLARIVRIRKEKAILSNAAQKAYKAGEKKILEEITAIAKPYAAREAAIRNKTRLKRLERRTKKDRG